MYDDWVAFDRLKLSPYYLTLARDSYDNCLAYLDETLGRLMGDLGRRGLLEETWVVIVGDHGEGLGEHDLYDHGESLYSTEVRVPLLILPPTGLNQPAQVVRETVSLRDLPATLVDVIGLAKGSPFPGRSLASYWGQLSPATDPDDGRRDPVGATALRIATIPIMDDRPFIEGPLMYRSPTAIWFIFAMIAMGRRSCTTRRDDPQELTQLGRAGPEGAG